jgi:two-component system KDP operon response regulator KdpE
VPVVSVGPGVLVVDDDRAIRLVARFILEGAGYAVTEAGTAAEALESLHTARWVFAVVLLDYTLPDRNGTELLPELRAVAPRARVVLTSGRPAEDVPEHGADAYLPKPFTREQLLAAICTANAVAAR